VAAKKLEIFIKYACPGSVRVDNYPVFLDNENR